MPFGKIRGFPAGQQAVIFDKSAFQGLSRFEHGQRQFLFRENITPILLREILGDLTKTESALNIDADGSVRLLARKFVGSGGVVNAECRKLCHASLAGAHFEADGRPLLDDYVMGRDGDGSLAMLVDLTESNRAILRWAQGEFKESERRTSLGHRASIQAFSAERLRGRLRQHNVLVPRPRNIADIGNVAGEMLAVRALQRALIDWLMEQCLFPDRHRREIFVRWEMQGRPMLSEFAPYAHHCVRILLMLLIGSVHRLLSDRPTNRFDVEYLFYSPFCEIFVSSDRIHAQLAPLVLWEGQRFLNTTEFKAELAKLVAERRAGRPGQSPTAPNDE